MRVTTQRRVVEVTPTESAYVRRGVPATAHVAGHPVHAALVPFPIVCFTLALLTDVAYWQSGTLMWQHFSAWLLFVGIVMGGLAALFGLVDMLSRDRLRSDRNAIVHGVGNVIVLLLALVNNLVHARDGWTSVVPWGLTLSALTVLGMIVTVWFGRDMVFREGVGVRYDV
ncbi:DUF2231 domain-containing protein [Frigidibacter sp. SD6-1]|uniref:DUF2231 domain-containing protein n=1 Tax=Frigidibacter sp. SD6-1 TaxID=3032581 RepID=UPI0024DF6B87|nr:DUF2231 domain-containing protein [Frigidibacter sp. SD6-1]